jgi:threonine dehydrogenase-like Zn-dependent dehydrogenase
MPTMKSVTCTHAKLEVAETDAPDPGPGQVRLEVLRCGICGSDLHARTGIDEWADVAGKIGYEKFGRSHESIVFGHEFCGAVAEYGTKTKGGVASGAPVVALPLLRAGSQVPNGVDPIGLCAAAPGAYAEQMLIEESLMLPVPNGLDPDIATMTEPMAVAWHAVIRSEIKKRDVAIVIGCGPVGLGVILGLKAKGVRTVVAADFSPGRRSLAAACGADIVLDPAEESPYEAANDKHLTSAPDTFELAVSTQEKLARLPIGWWHAWRLADKLGVKPAAPVIFECVGAPGIIEDIISSAPLFSRVVVVGVCVGEDRFTPAMAINKEIDFRFVLGYTPLEFRDTLVMLAEGKIDPRPMLTGRVGLGGVAAAFEALGDPEAHAKIVVDPSSEATEPAL